MKRTKTSQKPCLLFIHGYGSSKDSRKFGNLKDYFQDRFDYAYMDWTPESDFPKLLNSTFNKIKDYRDLIIVGDSTGANFAIQIKDRYINSGKPIPLLILTSPLLNVNYRLQKDDVPFTDNLKSALWEAIYPSNGLIIATKEDDVVDQTWLFENYLDKVKLIEVNDHHRLLKFKEYLEEIDDYYTKRKNSNMFDTEDWRLHKISFSTKTTGIEDVDFFIGPPDFVHGHRVKISNRVNIYNDIDCFVLSLPELEIIAGERNTKLITDEKLEKIKEFLKLNMESILRYSSDFFMDTWEFLKGLKAVK